MESVDKWARSSLLSFVDSGDAFVGRFAPLWRHGRGRSKPECGPTPLGIISFPTADNSRVSSRRETGFTGRRSPPEPASEFRPAARTTARCAHDVEGWRRGNHCVSARPDRCRHHDPAFGACHEIVKSPDAGPDIAHGSTGECGRLGRPDLSRGATITAGGSNSGTSVAGAKPDPADQDRWKSVEALGRPGRGSTSSRP